MYKAIGKNIGLEDASYLTENRNNYHSIASRRIAAFAILMLAGCAAAPKVDHAIVRSAADLEGDQIATYALQENLVTIKPVTTGEGDKKKTTVTAEISRQDHEGLRIALLRKRRIGINTDVAIKKFENTDIPSEVTVKVEDTRADLIKKAGELVVGIIKSGIAFTGQEAILPARLNLSNLVKNVTLEGGIYKDTRNHIDVEFGPLPADAFEVGSLTAGAPSSYFHYAACRSAVVTLDYSGAEYQFTFKIADPRYLQRQRMPVDGKIVMHSQCGASVTGKLASDDAATALAISSALVAQGQSINDALKAAKDEKE